MTKTFSFKLEMRNTGNTAYPVYVAEETVDAPYTVHLHLDSNAKQRPVPLVIEHKSEDSDFIKIDNLSISVLKARGFVYDKSFSSDEWPKQVRITSPLPVLDGSMTVDGGVLEEIEKRVSAIEEKVPELYEEFLSKTDSLNDSVIKLKKVDENLAKLVADIVKENAVLKERITAVETENATIRDRIATIETFLSSKVFMTQE